ncbi:uncharacterized protein [Danio rerio]|uniref:Uncharacterized protein n=1 Tax=Danio rerio TaxID=7955 RepID=A0AC58G9G0_DANRE
MSADGNPTSPSHARPLRQCQAPRYLEDYVLDSHHRPALTSSTVHSVMEEPKGAAAAVYSSQADVTSSQGRHLVTPSPSQADLLSVDSLTKLMETINEKDKEENAEMHSLLRKLEQLKKRKQRREEMMEHITSFIREEQGNENNEPVQSSPAPSNPSSPPPLPSWDTVPQSEHQVAAGLSMGPEKSSHQMSVMVSRPTVGSHNAAYESVNQSRPQTTGLLCSPPSSGMASPVPHPPQSQLYEPMSSQAPRPLPRQEQASTAHSERSFHPLEPQVISPTPVYPRSMAPYGYIATPYSQMQLVNAPNSHNLAPPYQAMMSSTLLPQNMFSGPMPSVSTAAVAPQLVTAQVAAPPNGSIPQRALYSPPKPKIPDFTNDSERDFANMKLALDNLLEPYPELTEKYKYHVLLEHLKLPEAQMIGQSCRHHPYPYSAAMQALQLQYGQPHQLAQSEIAAILTSPDVKPNDGHSFQSFALRVHLLVSMLLSLEGPRGMELNCCSHVDRLLSKLPKYLRDGFIEFLQQQGKLNALSLNPYNLQDFAGWLQVKAQQQRLSNRLMQRYQHERPSSIGKEKTQAITKGTSLVLYQGAAPNETALPTHPKENKQRKPLKVQCLFCNSKEHYITRCDNIKEQSVAELHKWISDGRRCWKCARFHAPEMCNLKKPCSDCGRIHLQVLHRIASNDQPNTSGMPESRIYLTPASVTCRVLLKVVPVLLHGKFKSVETYAILDDGAQRTIVLPMAAQMLQLKGEPEVLTLRTVRADVTHLSGSKINLEISPKGEPNKRFQILDAFTASGLDLVEQSYPVQRLQKLYAHLRGLPLQSFHNVRPLVLIGSDHVHLITADKPVHQGVKGGPVAIHTALGWALQGAEKSTPIHNSVQQCLFTSASCPNDLLYRSVEKLWQLDILPYRNEKLVVRSREDQEAIKLLECKTQTINVEGVQRYATPLLRKPGAPTLLSTTRSVMPTLRSIERKLQRDPEKATIYSREIEKLIKAGYVTKIHPEEISQSKEAWYIPHHLVCHNDKPRLVFNCSFRSQGQSLNDQLLPGPALGPSLLGVLLRFRQYNVAVSADIRGMFHQVRLLPEDRPLLRFIWRDLQYENCPDVYEWQVLPFGTTSSPCCAIFAVQQHARNYQESYPSALQTIQQSFYVDNYLASFPTTSEARVSVDQLRSLLATGGFDLRQWASNQPAVISHLPTEARSSAAEQWLAQNRTDPMEPTLGLRWNCAADTLGYHYRPIEHATLTMRTAYQILATQYDPLGFIVPFTTRAKVLIQQLWSKKRDWDDPNLPQDLSRAWETWENELKHLSDITIPRCYSSIPHDAQQQYELHVFCDASERAYGAVAYLVEYADVIHSTFVMARSRIAPKRQQSIPRLELCAALAGAQLAKLLKEEITLKIQQIVLWTDSTTVLEWLQSDSCRFKVFVGTRVSEIQDLTEHSTWRYVDTQQNPADDITRGKPLQSFTIPGRWSQGPSFLNLGPEHWPKRPEPSRSEGLPDLKGANICCLMTVVPDHTFPDATHFHTWKELVEATRQADGKATGSQPDTQLMDHRTAELELIKGCQAQSFPEETAALKMHKPVPNHSRLRCLAPEWDPVMEVIRVGGRLRRLESLNAEETHPIVLHPQHPTTKLLIKEFDERLLHPGTERVYAELRRQYWILRGRQAVKHHQLKCSSCQRWRAQPKVPKMADLPPERLRILCPPFYSTGVDCFGPYQVKIGRRVEKRWGVIFKCLTTRAVHIELLNSMDVDAFLLALRRFMARRGRPKELRSDCGTNFRGADRELREAFAAMESPLKERLADHQITFKFNPPHAPHFGGTWEREVRSIKTALRAAVGGQSVSEDVLTTVLVEVEGILNSKPLGYVSTDIADPDPITPNLLLMGRRDASLPQVTYASGEMGRRRWRHCQNLVDQFLTQFTRNYLPTLQTRQKWQTSSDNLKVGSVVLIVDPQLT